MIKLLIFKNLLQLTSRFSYFLALTTNNTDISHDVNSIAAEEVRKELCAILECVKKTKIIGSLIILIKDFHWLLNIFLPNSLKVQYNNFLSTIYNIIIKTLIQMGTLIKIFAKLSKLFEYSRLSS